MALVPVLLLAVRHSSSSTSGLGLARPEPAPALIVLLLAPGCAAADGEGDVDDDEAEADWERDTGWDSAPLALPLEPLLATAIEAGPLMVPVELVFAA